MHRMLSAIRHRRIMPFALATLGLSWWASALAGNLDLASAENLALENDPSVLSLRARVSAMSDLEVAAGQLPDPMLKVGLISLPTDTFHLGQEAMTQVQLGVAQTFPRGKTRTLRSEQIKQRAGALDDKANDLSLLIRRAVREEFIEVQKQQHLASINRDAEAAFEELEAITLNYYATGRVQQQDVLRAGVELARVRERSVHIAEDEQKARARLAAWIGDSAWRELESGWPSLETPAPLQNIKERLNRHPRILAFQRETLAAEKSVELADQNYKPEFTLDLTYGGRGGNGPNGLDRPDLLSLMLRLDMPLFADKRQDRIRAASIAHSSAAAFDRDDAYRRLLSEVEVHFYAWERQRDRLELFESSLLPGARNNAEASLDAYQSALDDLTTVVRARLIQFDLQLEQVHVQAERLKSQARLLYLEGK